MTPNPCKAPAGIQIHAEDLLLRASRCRSHPDGHSGADLQLASAALQSCSNLQTVSHHHFGQIAVVHLEHLAEAQ